MALLNRFDPPGFLPDFNNIPGQIDAWNRAVSNWFEYSIKTTSNKIHGDPIQFYNPAIFDPGGVMVEQAIVWNAFPKQLLREFGRDVALQMADRLWHIEEYRSLTPEPDAPSAGANVLYRPQEEYCEWLAQRDPESNKILRVTFTSEPPEFWQALFGLVPGSDGLEDQRFPSNPSRLVKLYQELVDPRVRLEDLVAATDLKDANGNVWAAKGQYNIYNKWNTTHGIAHLNSPPNSLVAEIQLGADASLLYIDPRGKLLVEPEGLISYSAFGGANRNSDPTIGSTVNALARLGAYITLRNPVGLYMDHIDISGWEAPDGKGVQDCIHIVRGTLGMIERLVIEVPPSRNFNVGDIAINGRLIHYGGQIAECITVKLVGVANIPAQPLKSLPSGIRARGYIDQFFPTTVALTKDGTQPIPVGNIEAFLGQGASEGPAGTGRERPRASVSELKVLRLRRR